MTGRFFTITYYMIQAIVAYLLLICTKKKQQHCLVQANFGKSGGTRTYFFYLIEYLSRRQLHLTVMLTKNQYDNEVIALQSKFPFKKEEMNFELQRTTFNGTVFYKKTQEDLIYQLKELIFFWNALRRNRSSLFVISEGTPELLLFLLFSPVKMIFILHTVATQKLSHFKFRLLNLCFSSKKKIVTVSEFSKKLLLQNWTKGNHENSIKVVHNFYEPRNQVAMPYEKNCETVLSIGSLGHHKNPFFWITVCGEVLKHYKEPIRFIWAGDGELLEQCRAKSRHISQIQFIGDQKNVEQLYTDCTIYFQPSLLESHGIAVLGAMYFEKPCVVSDRQGLPESVIHNLSGLVVPVEDVTDSVNAILFLLNNAAKANDFAKEAKKRGEKEFTKVSWNLRMDYIFNDMYLNQQRKKNIPA